MAFARRLKVLAGTASAGAACYVGWWKFTESKKVSQSHSPPKLQTLTADCSLYKAVLSLDASAAKSEGKKPPKSIPSRYYLLKLST